MVRCLICHRVLKDQESLQRQIGPTCFNRLKKIKVKHVKAVEPVKAKSAEGQISLFD